MIDIHTLTLAEFKCLPLVIEGESKEVRYAGDGMVVIRFKPTIYSFTQNRCAEVAGSHIPRLRACRLFIEELRRHGIRHAYRDISDAFVLADLVMPHPIEFKKYGLPPFTPPDLTPEQIAALPKAPPIEVVVKRYLTGTTKHSLIGAAGSHVRDSHPFYAGMPLEGDGALPEMLVRFDWRNPLTHPGNGLRMANQILQGIEHVPDDIRQRIIAYGDRTEDKVLEPQFADLYIDIVAARRTAFTTARIIEEMLAARDIVFYDLCLFIDERGETVYGEISPDCGRYRHLDLGELDKDVWRTGGGSQDVINKWNLLVTLLKGTV